MAPPPPDRRPRREGDSGRGGQARRTSGGGTGRGRPSPPRSDRTWGRDSDDRPRRASGAAGGRSRSGDASSDRPRRPSTGGSGRAWPRDADDDRPRRGPRPDRNDDRPRRPPAAGGRGRTGSSWSRDTAEDRPRRSPQRGRGWSSDRPSDRGERRPWTDDDPERAARRQQRDRQEQRAPRKWGGVARRGTRELAEPEPGSASDAWRKAVDRSGRREEWQPERWEREPEAPTSSARPAARPPRRGDAPRTPARERQPERPAERRPRRKAPAPIATELTRIAGPKRAPRLEERLMEAAKAYERERYADARRIVARLAEEAPAAPAVRELHGLTLYRMGKWRDATKELEAYRTLTDSVEQNPVLADAYRALRKYKKVQELWDELRQISPGAEIVAEGRIVAAGALADQGRIDEAIVLLERGRLTSKNPRDHHLRLWYALADLYERAGDVPRARELFRRVAEHEPDFADAAERLSGLG